jgi:hypothetical protein
MFGCAIFFAAIRSTSSTDPGGNPPPAVPDHARTTRHST